MPVTVHDGIRRSAPVPVNQLEGAGNTPPADERGSPPKRSLGSSERGRFTCRTTEPKNKLPEVSNEMGRVQRMSTYSNGRLIRCPMGGSVPSTDGVGSSARVPGRLWSWSGTRERTSQFRAVRERPLRSKGRVFFFFFRT